MVYLHASGGGRGRDVDVFTNAVLALLGNRGGIGLEWKNEKELEVLFTTFEQKNEFEDPIRQVQARFAWPAWPARWGTERRVSYRGSEAQKVKRV